MSKLKVLQVNKLYYPFTGGIERIVQQIAEGLCDQVDMKVLVCSDKRKYISENINGVKIVRVPSLFMLGNIPIPVGFLMQFRKLMKDRDVVQFHMPYPFGDLSCLLSGYKGKVVVWWHSDVVRQKKMMYFYKPIMERFLERADVIIVATKGHINGSKYLQPYKNKCVIIPFGVDRKIEEAADEYVALPQNLRVNARVRFLFVGRLVYYKGCKVLLEAFAQVPNAELVLVGNGDMKNVLKEIVKVKGLGKHVVFLGDVNESDLIEEFRKCDVFVLPSVARSEAFGIVQIEAMAFGKPVINTNLPSGVPYVSIHGITGLTVEPGSVKDLAKAMNWMVENRQERLEMGKRARSRMKEKYRIEDMLKEVRKIYDS